MFFRVIERDKPDWSEWKLPKVLHIFPAEKFTGPFVNFINNNFSPEDHLFLILGDNSKYQDLSTYNNVISFLFHESESKIRNARKLISLSRSSEKIIIHGLFSRSLLMFLNLYLLFGSKKKKAKLYWRIWGADLYNQFLISPKRRFYILRKAYRSLIFSMKKRIIMNLDGIISPVQGDYDFAVSKYKTNAKYFKYGNYAVYEPKDFEEIKKTKHPTDVPTVLLGNSASQTNEHYEAIDLLKSLREYREFRVLCPLSYGDNEYREKVIEYGKDKLGESFEPILNYIAESEYISLLDSIDIAIMNHKRQQALGNIAILIRLGKKVYLRKQNPVYKHYIDMGAKVFSIDSISKDNPEKFFEFDKETSEGNKKAAFSYNSKENVVKSWRDVFDS